jgi:hypothetical protein
MTTTADTLRAVRDRAFWIALAPHLHITSTPRVPHWALSANADAARASIRKQGFATLERVVPDDVCRALRDGLRCLHDANIPTPFLFAFDEAWELAIGLKETFDALVGGEARVMRDVWAWHIAVAKNETEGTRGWKPHRGVSWDVRDARGEPTLLNIWIALTDVGEESACMHVVPLDRDPHFPSELESDEADAPAIALPVPSGSVLAWNANVLHWGGEMRRGEPRASASFSIRSIDIAQSERIDPHTLTLDDRIDVISDMIATYAVADGVANEWREWAGLDYGLRAARSVRR